jgi:hypothetical protein
VSSKVKTQRVKLPSHSPKFQAVCRGYPAKSKEFNGRLHEIEEKSNADVISGLVCLIAAEIDVSALSTIGKNA